MKLINANVKRKCKNRKKINRQLSLVNKIDTCQSSPKAHDFCLSLGFILSFSELDNSSSIEEVTKKLWIYIYIYIYIETKCVQKILIESKLQEKEM